VEITTESIRQVVRDEQAPRFKSIENAIEKMANSCERMAELTAESISEHRITNEKHKQVRQSIDSQDERISEITRSVNSITTNIIPDMQRSIDQNSLTAKVFWKFLLIAGTPLCGGIGSILFLFQKSQESQNVVIAKAITSLAVSVSGIK